MKFVTSASLIILLFLACLTCTAQKRRAFKPKEVLKSDSLIITQLSENTFEHTTYLKTNDFGNVPCNGLIVRDGSEVVIFDTPTSNTGSAMLIFWVEGILHCKVKAIIPTHFHNDCLAGLTMFHKQNIPSYASFKTIELAKANGYVIPENGFADSLELTVVTEKVFVKFFGEGHTRDNVVGYFPKENVLFGGCLIKEVGATKGYLGDANVAAWSGTVEKIKQEYPNVKVVVPGHGKYGNKKLLDYTITLFKNERKITSLIIANRSDSTLLMERYEIDFLKRKVYRINPNLSYLHIKGGKPRYKVRLTYADWKEITSLVSSTDFEKLVQYNQPADRNDTYFIERSLDTGETLVLNLKEDAMTKELKKLFKIIRSSR